MSELDNIVIEFTREEFEYMKGVFKSLYDMQSKIPDKLKTKKTNVLCNLYLNKFGVYI